MRKSISMHHQNRRALLPIIFIVALQLSFLFPVFAAAPSKLILGYAAPGVRALPFWLEHFGLDVQRDQMQLQAMGEQALTIQALEAGVVNAAIFDGIFSRRLKPKGFTILGEYSELKYQFVSQALVVQRSLLQQR